MAQKLLHSAQDRAVPNRACTTALFVCAMPAVTACRVTLAAGSDDEEHFQKKDKARLARDKLRLNPIVLGETTMLCDLVHSDLHHTNLP